MRIGIYLLGIRLGDTIHFVLIFCKVNIPHKQVVDAYELGER